MERFAVAEARYQDAVRKLVEAGELLYPVEDQQFPPDARDRLEKAKVEIETIAKAVNDIAWQVGKLSIER